MIQGKVWGTSECIFENDNFAVYRITMYKNSYCSQHLHNFKHNLFYVEAGKIRIKAWKNDYELIDKTVLSKGQKTDIPPTEKHRFEALEESVAFEIYFSEPIGKDIERFDCGGLNFNLLKEGEITK